MEEQLCRIRCPAPCRRPALLPPRFGSREFAGPFAPKFFRAKLSAGALRRSRALRPEQASQAPKVFALFGLSKEQEKYERVYEFCIYEGNNVTRGEPLFPRLDVKLETEFISSISH